jgi:hypothetical protein
VEARAETGNATGAEAGAEAEAEASTGDLTGAKAEAETKAAAENATGTEAQRSSIGPGAAGLPRETEGGAKRDHTCKVRLPLC